MINNDNKKKKKKKKERLQKRLELVYIRPSIFSFLCLYLYCITPSRGLRAAFRMITRVNINWCCGDLVWGVANRQISSFFFFTEFSVRHTIVAGYYFFFMFFFCFFFFCFLFSLENKFRIWHFMQIISWKQDFQCPPRGFGEQGNKAIYFRGTKI